MASSGAAATDEQRSALTELPVEQLMQVSKGRILTSIEFRKAVEALVAGVESGAVHSDQAQERIHSCRRLLCSRVQVPLALWWTYASLELQNAAVGVATTVSGDERAMLVISASKLLLDRLRSLCAGRVDGYTGIAVLAPVLASLYQAFLLLKSETTSRKRRRKTLKALKNSLEEVLSVMALYNKRLPEGEPVDTVEEEALALDFRGLVLAAKGINRLSETTPSGGKGLATIYPLSSKEVREASVLRSRPVEYWAGVVAAEVVLMRLVVSILVQREQKYGFASADFVEELKLLGVHGACAFSKGTIVNLAMEADLPVSSLLNSEEVKVLRAALYEALLVDPAPISPQYSSSEAFCSFVLKLALARRAVDYYRSHNERTKAIAISSRTAMSTVPLGFSKWLRAQKLKKKPDEDVYKDPRRLIGWLTQTADERTVARILSELSPPDRSSYKLEINQLELREEAVEGDMFFVDKKGADNVTDQLAADRAFAAAAEDMRSERQSDNEESLSSEDDEELARDNDELPAGDNDEGLAGDNDEKPAGENDEAEVDADGEATAVQAAANACDTEWPQKSSLESSVEAVLASSIQEIEAAEEKLQAAAVEPMETETGEEKGEAEIPARQEEKEQEVAANVESPMRQDQPAVVEAVVTPRCTRSGRKYGAFQAPLAMSSRKKRRI